MADPATEARLKSLTERLTALENGKVAVKQLPINELRNALAREPQDPHDILLPHSVGPDLLETNVTGEQYIVATSSPATESTSYVAAPGVATTVAGGAYVVNYGCSDFSSGSRGGRIALYNGGSEIANFFISGGGTWPGNNTTKVTLESPAELNVRYKVEGGTGNGTFYALYMNIRKVE